MEIVLLILGVAWVIGGTLMIFTTDMIKKNVFAKVKKLDYKKLAPIGIVIGVLFLIAAPLSRAKIFVTVLGILALIKSFYFLLAPKDKVKKLLDWWFNADDKFYKIWGGVVLALGVLLLISI